MYVSGSYTQNDIIREIDAAENGLTSRFQKDGVITDAAEQRYWRELIEKASFGRNTVLYDDQGNPSVMVVIPAFTEADVLDEGANLPHPAFIVNGAVKGQIYISKYPNAYKGSGTSLRAYSLKNVDPGNSITFDNAILACKQKGTGWHLMTNAEWAALALLSRKQGFMPRGNNYYGKDISVPSEKAAPSYIYAGAVGRTLTGSGPISWSHDGTPFCVCDLNGNVWEWCGGYRTLGGEIHILPNNNAADPNNSQASGSTLWRAILEDGSLTDPGDDGTLKWDCVGSTITLCKTITNQADVSRGTEFINLGKAAEVSTVPEILKALALYPADNGDHGGDYFYMNNGAGLERLAYRGGSWLSTSLAGVFFAGGYNFRSVAFTGLGFRSAFIPV